MIQSQRRAQLGRGQGTTSGEFRKIDVSLEVVRIYLFKNR
jgi:hypothetical protein